MSLSNPPLNNLSTYPTGQVQVRDVVCRIVSVEGTDPDYPGTGYTDTLTYTMSVFTIDGVEPPIPGIVPSGQRWPRPFRVRVPRINTPEAMCRGIQYGPDLFVFVNEIPDWGPCSGETPPSGDDVPIGGTTPGTPMRPIGIPGPAFAHMLLAMSTQQLAAFYLAGKAAAGEAGK
jgi:hypothetical protein